MTAPIAVDASAVPDFPSGARTRLRGLYGAYAVEPAHPAVELWIASSSTLMDGIELPPDGSVRLRRVARPGGPLRRALRARLPRRGSQGFALWHSETIPPLAPRRVPRLLTLHDLRWHSRREDAGGSAWGHWLRHRAATRWLPRLAREVDGVVTVSAASRAEIHRVLGVPHQRIHLVENAAFSTQELREEEDEGWDRLETLGVVPPFVLSVGHLEARKGLDLVLTALARARPDSATATVQYVLVGEGPDRERLERLARGLHLEARVRFLGRRSDREVRSLMRRCLALVFPSRIEGFGFPVFEALERGCPVLSTPLPCLDEVRDEGLVRSDPDAELWERKIHWIFHHRDELRRDASGRSRLLGGSSWEDSAARLAEVYRSTIAASSRARPR